MICPGTLDGARVLYWLLSENGQPFCCVVEGDLSHPIIAMAICRYEDSGSLYLFKCDPAFEVQADLDVGSVVEAMAIVENSWNVPPEQWQRAD